MATAGEKDAGGIADNKGSNKTKPDSNKKKQNDLPTAFGTFGAGNYRGKSLFNFKWKAELWVGDPAGKLGQAGGKTNLKLSSIELTTNPEGGMCLKAPVLRSPSNGFMSANVSLENCPDMSNKLSIGASFGVPGLEISEVSLSFDGATTLGAEARVLNMGVKGELAVEVGDGSGLMGRDFTREFFRQYGASWPDHY